MGGIFMKIAICDDEKIFRERLIKALNEYTDKYGYTFSYYEYSDGCHLLSADITYDLIFMDYQMNKTNGIDVVDTLRKRNDDTTVIFISSFKDMVFKSFEVRTYRFLVKPLNINKLYEALSSFIKMYDTEKYLIVKNDKLDMSERITEDSVIYAEADNVYCKIRTADNTYVYKKTLSTFEKMLRSDFFFRVHRTYLVNLKYISSYSETEIIMDNNEKALIAKTKYHSFQQAYFNYLKRCSLGIIK